MEEIRVNHSVWKMLLRAIMCFTIVALFIRLNDGLNLSDYGLLGLFFFFGFVVLGLYFLFILIKERLLGQPFIAISSDSLVVSWLLRKKKVINFSDVKSFECNYTVRGLGPAFLHIYFKKGMDRVKDSINISSIDANVYNLWHLLGRVKTLFRHSSQYTIDIQRDKFKKLHKKWDSNKNCYPFSTTGPKLSMILVIYFFGIAYFVFSYPDNFNGIFHNVNSLLGISEFLIFIVLGILFVFLIYQIRTHIGMKSNCLILLLVPLFTVGFLLTTIYIMYEYHDSFKSCFYYHTSSNGIRYGIPKIGEKEATIMGITEGTYAIDIPEFIIYKDAKYPVTTIDEEAFNSCTSLTSVIIGDSVKSIRYYAFRYCSNLRYLNLNNS